MIAALSQRCGRRLAQRAEKYARRLGVQSRHVSRDLGSARSATRPGLEAPTLCKEAVAEALGAGDDFYRQLVAEYRERRDLL